MNPATRVEVRCGHVFDALQPLTDTVLKLRFELKPLGLINPDPRLVHLDAHVLRGVVNSPQIPPLVVPAGGLHLQGERVEGVRHLRSIDQRRSDADVHDSVDAVVPEEVVVPTRTRRRLVTLLGSLPALHVGEHRADHFQTFGEVRRTEPCCKECIPQRGWCHAEMVLNHESIEESCVVSDLDFRGVGKELLDQDAANLALIFQAVPALAVDLLKRDAYRMRDIRHPAIRLFRTRYSTAIHHVRHSDGHSAESAFGGNDAVGLYVVSPVRIFGVEPILQFFWRWPPQDDGLTPSQISVEPAESLCHIGVKDRPPLR